MPTPEEEIEPQEEAPKPLEVDLSEDADDAEPEDKSGKPPKKERRESFRRDTMEAARRAQAAEERAAALERQVAELRGHVQGIQQVVPRQAQADDDENPSDPAMAEVLGIREQQNGILQQLRAQGITQEETNRLTRQFNKLDQKRRFKETEIVVSRRQMQGPSPQQLQEETDNRQLAAEFPDVFGDPAKMRRAQAELIDMVRAGKPYNIATAREAASKVRGPQRRVPAVNEADKARFTSVPAQAGGAPAGRFQPNRLQLSAARAYTSHMPDMSDEERVRVWAKNVGKKHGLI